MRKSLIITTCLLTLLPLSKVAANESLVEVVDAVINESLEAKLLDTDKDIPLSSDAYRYQDGFQVLKDMNNEQKNLNKKMTMQGIKYEANQLVYGYYKEKQAVKLQEANLKLVEKEYENSQERYKEGMSTKGAMLKAEIGVNEAKLAVKAAKLTLKEATSRLNQKLGKEFNVELEIRTLPEFSLLPSVDYGAEMIAKELNNKQPSLVLIRKKLQEYSNILHQIDSLPHLDEEELLKQLHDLDQQISKPPTQIEDVDGKIPGGEEAPDLWKGVNEELEASREALLKEYNKSLGKQSKAKLELKEYYANEIQKTEIELVQAERIVKLKAYEFENRFEVLSDRIKIAEGKVEQTNSEHNQQKELYELGEIIFLDVQKSQQQLRAIELDLMNDQLDYQLLKEEFSLFKEGYMM